MFNFINEQIFWLRLAEKKNSIFGKAFEISILIYLNLRKYLST